MKGLFIKDFYVLRKIMLYYAVIVVVFAGLGVITDNPGFIFGISIASSIGITLSAMAYDERDGWTAYAVASGISAKSVVLEKYLLGLICPVLCTLFTIIIYVCMGNTAIIPEIISYALCYPIVIEAICLPIVNKTGVEQGRALMIVAVLLGILFYILISSVTGSVSGASAFVLLAVAFITAASAVIISYSISLCVFGKKEF